MALGLQFTEGIAADDEAPAHRLGQRDPRSAQVRIDIVDQPVVPRGQDARELSDERPLDVHALDVPLDLLEQVAQTLRPEKTNLNDLVVATGSLLRRTLGEHIEINSLLAEELWETNTDRGQVEAAAINLCINARDAMPNGGRLFIRTRNVTLDQDYAALNPEARPGDYVALSVTDTGTGIAKEVQDKIFKPFFSTKGDKGTGLGLAICSKIIAQHKGDIRVESELGKGTTFTIFLPVWRGTR